MVGLNEIDDPKPKINKREINTLLREYFKWKGHVSLPSTGLVTVEGDIELIKIPPNGKIPVDFGIVTGYFLGYKMKMITLKGSPRSVRTLSVTYNNLRSLIGGPNNVYSNLYLEGNPLTSLEGLPKVGGTISLDWSKNLPMLRLVGKDLKIFGQNEVTQIFKKYDGDSSRASIISCQKELIDAGFEGNASW